MNLEKMYEMQEIVDNKIAEKMPEDWGGFAGYESVMHRTFAFHIELAELANEIGFFKDWKHSHTVDMEKVSKELADCLAFAFSIGLTRGYSKLKSEIAPFPLWQDYPYYDTFETLRSNNLDTLGKWELAISILIGLGLRLGLTEQDIEQEFLAVCEDNIQRQEQNY